MSIFLRLLGLALALGLMLLAFCDPGEILLSDLGAIYMPLDRGIIQWAWGVSIAGFLYGGMTFFLLRLHAPVERVVYRGNTPNLEYSGGGPVWPRGAMVGGAVLLLSGGVLFLLLLRVIAE